MFVVNMTHDPLLALVTSQLNNLETGDESLDDLCTYPGKITKNRCPQPENVRRRRGSSSSGAETP